MDSLGRKIWLIVTDIKSPDAHEAPGLFQVKEKTLVQSQPRGIDSPRASSVTYATPTEASLHPSLLSKVGSLAMLLAMRRASSSVSTLAMWASFGFSRE